MAGIIAQYTQVPRLRSIITDKLIPSDGATNPADQGPVSLPNVRGQVSFTITTSDNAAGISSSFSVRGGFGEYPDDYTQNWYFLKATNVNCTVTSPAVNTIIVTTAAPAVVRVYEFVFKPVQSIGATVTQTSVNLLGANDLTVRMVKEVVTEGF